MSRYVLDASALLASLHNEPGSDVVDPLLPECTISTVNLAEVLQKAIQQGIPTDTLVNDLQILGVQIMDYTLEHAERTAQLWPLAKPLGLSLGDRACLALTQILGATALTSDRAWAGISGVSVQVIR